MRCLMWYLCTVLYIQGDKCGMVTFLKICAAVDLGSGGWWGLSLAVLTDDAGYNGAAKRGRPGE